jgi:hypothetical protein
LYVDPLRPSSGRRPLPRQSGSYPTRRRSWLGVRGARGPELVDDAWKLVLTLYGRVKVDPLLWGHCRDGHGLAAFAASAAPQLVRWESQYGWTRRGFGQISQKETSLAEVLGGMLSVPDMWVTFARRYLDTLDHPAATRDKPWISNDYARRQRTGDLAACHEMLLQRLADTEAEDLLDQLVQHRCARPVIVRVQGSAGVTRPGRAYSGRSNCGCPLRRGIRTGVASPLGSSSTRCRSNGR